MHAGIHCAEREDKGTVGLEPNSNQIPPACASVVCSARCSARVDTHDVQTECPSCNVVGLRSCSARSAFCFCRSVRTFLKGTHSSNLLLPPWKWTCTLPFVWSTARTLALCSCSSVLASIRSWSVAGANTPTNRMAGSLSLSLSLSLSQARTVPLRWSSARTLPHVFSLPDASLIE